MIIRHDRSDRASLVDPCKWPAITSFFRGHGMASLIAPTWLLSAAQDSQFLLAGVSSWQHQGGRPLGLYGCIEHYARVSRYADWIRETCASGL
jgi:hypothetical protein